MKVDLNPVISLAIYFDNFADVDLYRRGYFQISFNIVPTSACKKYIKNITYERTSIKNASSLPSTVHRMSGSCKPLVLHYTNEIVKMDDFFRCKLELREGIDETDDITVQLHIQLLFGGRERPENSDAYKVYSFRDIDLVLSLKESLHFSRPVFFHQFQFAAFTFNVNASLTSLNPTCKHPMSDSSIINTKLLEYNRRMCGILLSTYRSLQLFIHRHAEIITSTIADSSAAVVAEIIDVEKELQRYEAANKISNSELWAKFEENARTLSTSLTQLFDQLLFIFGNCRPLIDALYDEFDGWRMKRLGEAFVYTEETMDMLKASLEGLQHILRVGDIIDLLTKNTPYYAKMPKAKFHVEGNDPTAATMDVLVERRYVPTTIGTPKQSLNNNLLVLPASSDPAIPSNFTDMTLLSNLKAPGILVEEIVNGNFPVIQEPVKRGMRKNVKKWKGIRIPFRRRSRSIGDFRRRDSDLQAAITSIDPRHLHRNSRGLLTLRRSASTPVISQKPDQKPGQNPNKKPDRTPHQKPDQTPHQKPGQKPGQKQDQKPDETPHRKPGETPHQKPHQKQDQKPDQKQDHKPDQKPGQKQDQKPDKKPDQKPDEKPGQRQDQIPDEKPDQKTKDGNGKPANANLSVAFDNAIVEFVRRKEEFKQKLHILGTQASLYSDLAHIPGHITYFTIFPIRFLSLRSHQPIHLVVLVHGLQGTCDDLSHYATYLHLLLPRTNLRFLMSEANQMETWNNFDQLAEKLLDEILTHLESYAVQPARISFIAHSLGAIIVRSMLAKERAEPLLPSLYTFLTLNAPHCGLLYNQRSISWSLAIVQWWKQSASIEQLLFRDASEAHETFIYKLSATKSFAQFKYVLLVGCYNDVYVPYSSAVVEPSKASRRDKSRKGKAYEEVVNNINESIINSPKKTTLVKYTILPSTVNASRTHQMTGRAVHATLIENELLAEKLLAVSAAKYFI